MATRILPLHGASFSRDDGIALAVQLLGELEDTAAQEACSIFSPEDKLRPTAEQRNILADYLAAIDATGSAEVRAGFTAVLTDLMACCIGGVVMGADFYDDRLLGAEASHG